LSSERDYNLQCAIQGWRTSINSTPAANALRVDIPPEKGAITQIGGFFLNPITASGGTYTVKVFDGAALIDQDVFVPATVKRVPYTVPMPATVAGTIGCNTISVLAEGTVFSAGLLTVIYRRIPL
jgi:hypothetical protein